MWVASSTENQKISENEFFYTDEIPIKIIINVIILRAILLMYFFRMSEFNDISSKSRIIEKELYYKSEKNSQKVLLHIPM